MKAEYIIIIIFIKLLQILIKEFIFEKKFYHMIYLVIYIYIFFFYLYIYNYTYLIIITTLEKISFRKEVDKFLIYNVIFLYFDIFINLRLLFSYSLNNSKIVFFLFFNNINYLL